MRACRLQILRAAIHFLVAAADRGQGFIERGGFYRREARMYSSNMVLEDIGILSDAKAAYEAA